MLFNYKIAYSKPNQPFNKEKHETPETYALQPFSDIAPTINHNYLFHYDAMIS